MAFFLVLDIFWVIDSAIEVPQSNGSNTPSRRAFAGRFGSISSKFGPGGTPVNRACPPSFLADRLSSTKQKLHRDEPAPFGLGGIRWRARMPEALVLLRERVQRSD